MDWKSMCRRFDPAQNHKKRSNLTIVAFFFAFFSAIQVDLSNVQGASDAEGWHAKRGSTEVPKRTKS